MQDKHDYSDILPDWLYSRATIFSILERLDSVSRKSVAQVAREKSAIAFSGGIDSSILARLASESDNPNHLILITLGTENSPDLRAELPQIFESFKKIIGKIDQNTIADAISKVSKIVEVSNLSHLEDCVAFYLIAQQLSRVDGYTRILSANGPDELFCGYDRFRRIAHDNGYNEVKNEVRRSLDMAYELQSNVALMMNQFGFRSYEPFLQKEFVDFAMTSVPVELKVSRSEDKLRKRIWRAYGMFLGLPREIVLKPKKAMQYSMRIHPAITKMVRQGQLKLDFN